VNPRPFSVQERGLILVVAIGLAVTGIVLFVQNIRSTSLALPEAIDITGVRVLVPTFLAPDEVDERINLNTASVEELIELPGIGEVLAGRIVSYREVHGPFLSLSELKEINGIGDVLVERIRDLVTLETDNIEG
jgi:competence ComEA-like helix-hairpin-helix protein